MKIGIILITSLIVLGSVSAQSVFAHQPDFPVQTPEDILKFCEFFYEEFQTFGLDGLVDLHPQYPNLRACAILYNHIAWSSTHQARDVVLIAEIEKYLGDSSFLKERHISEFTTMPAWVIQDTVRWTKGDYKDSLYAYSVRALIENSVISPKIVDNVSQRLCIEGLCAKEADYVTYSHTSKFGNTITEKFEVEKIDESGITINSRIVSEEGIKNHKFLLDEDSRIPVDEKCCRTEKFLYKTPIEIGDVIDEKYQGFGFAVQAYQKRAFFVLDWLKKYLNEVNKKINIRLVKGAYWDTEIKIAQEQGFTDYPVFTKKFATDISYLACAHKLYENDNIFSQFATHNAHSISYIKTLFKDRDFEFQKLHGMGDEIYSYLEKDDNFKCRVYAPVGGYKDLLPYLVRRLLENGANTSFIHQLKTKDFDILKLVQSPLTKIDKLDEDKIKKPIEIYGDRKNSKGLDISEEEFNQIVLKTVVPPQVPNFNAKLSTKTWDFNTWYREIKITEKA